ncbi:hypothetical protein J3459_009957 [Metarhizium acridum]|nr:hypothetical protein J3459_009957 [Metarhizium acridum]
MKFLAAPVLAGPITRADLLASLALTARLVKSKKFRVDVGVAEDQARKAGFTTCRSGDPHRYMNGDNIEFGSHNCDQGKEQFLWKDPIYRVDKKAVVAEGGETDRQPGGPTPNPVGVCQQ